MATNTTNFNLIKPAYTDTADIADINGNMDKVDVSLNGLADAIAIVANNNTHAAIMTGQYVYVHGHGSLAEGLYTAKSNIAANATLSTSNLQADGSGGLNALNSKITNIGSYNSTSETSVSVATETATKIAELTPSAGYWLIIGNVTFASNATGSRTASLSMSNDLDSSWWESVQASPYGSTGLQIVRYQSFNGTDSVKLECRQTSGSSLNVMHRIFGIKLHD